ncbi:hypothetical protein [Flagellimonas maritima]|uniref:hypothetical protein n=1 Tax=Flagellimonas maritima TaxID=1383885 RepID=UPI0013DFCB5F|nr:hypothetical protein [Allomuricauda aurantiaca]
MAKDTGFDGFLEAWIIRFLEAWIIRSLNLMFHVHLFDKDIPTIQKIREFKNITI